MASTRLRVRIAGVVFSFFSPTKGEPHGWRPSIRRHMRRGLSYLISISIYTHKYWTVCSLRRVRVQTNLIVRRSDVFAFIIGQCVCICGAHVDHCTHHSHKACAFSSPMYTRGPDNVRARSEDVFLKCNNYILVRLYAVQFQLEIRTLNFWPILIEIFVRRRHQLQLCIYSYNCMCIWLFHSIAKGRGKYRSKYVRLVVFALSHYFCNVILRLSRLLYYRIISVK